MKTMALSEPRRAGDIVPLINRRFRIVSEMTREEFMRDLEERRSKTASSDYRPRAPRL
jgi:hypothetical protein